jgi:hypothetical protein
MSDRQGAKPLGGPTGAAGGVAALSPTESTALEWSAEALRDADDAGANLAVRQAPPRLFAGRRGRYFGSRRFDRQGARRLHVLTAAGLLDVDAAGSVGFDSADLIRLTRHVTRDESQAVAAFRHAAFNVLANNRDDHLRQFAFVRAPACDLTHSEGPGRRTHPARGRRTPRTRAGGRRRGRGSQRGRTHPRPGRRGRVAVAYLRRRGGRGAHQQGAHRRGDSGHAHPLTRRARIRSATLRSRPGSGASWGFQHDLEQTVVEGTARRGGHGHQALALARLAQGPRRGTHSRGCCRAGRTARGP